MCRVTKRSLTSPVNMEITQWWNTTCYSAGNPVTPLLHKQDATRATRQWLIVNWMKKFPDSEDDTWSQILINTFMAHRYVKEAAHWDVAPFARWCRRSVLLSSFCDGHSGLSLGRYTALVEASSSEGRALQHPIGLVKTDEEFRLLLLRQKTRLCRFDVLQKTARHSRGVQVQVGKGNLIFSPAVSQKQPLLTSRLNSSSVKPMYLVAML